MNHCLEGSRCNRLLSSSMRSLILFSDCTLVCFPAALLAVRWLLLETGAGRFRKREFFFFMIWAARQSTKGKSASSAPKLYSAFSREAIHGLTDPGHLMEHPSACTDKSCSLDILALIPTHLPEEPQSTVLRSDSH